MCFRKNNGPARLHKKQEKQIIIPPTLWIYIAFVLLFILAVLIAWLNKGAYYYNMGGLA